MKKFLLLLAALVVSSCTMIPAMAQDINWQHQMVEPTVQIERNCSGTFVLSERDEKDGNIQTLILTAKHCVAQQKIGAQIEVHYPVYSESSRRYKEELLYGTLKGKHSIYDLALIELLDEETLYPVATPATEITHVPRWSEVYTTGYPMGITQTVTEGRLNQRITLEQAPYKQEVFLTTIPIAGGSSGGGLYTKLGDKYLLIGVTSMGTERFPYGLFVPFNHIAEYLKPFLNMNEPGLTVPAYLKAK